MSKTLRQHTGRRDKMKRPANGRRQGTKAAVVRLALRGEI